MHSSRFLTARVAAASACARPLKLKDVLFCAKARCSRPMHKHALVSRHRRVFFYVQFLSIFSCLSLHIAAEGKLECRTLSAQAAGYTQQDVVEDIVATVF